LNVLIVDDGAANRKLLRSLLTGHRIETCDAVDGVQALDVLRQQKVDVMVTDILMPNMDGFRLC